MKKIFLVFIALAGCAPMEDFIPRKVDIVVVNLSNKKVFVSCANVDFCVDAKSSCEINDRPISLGDSLRLNSIKTIHPSFSYSSFPRIGKDGSPKGAIVIVAVSRGFLIATEVIQSSPKGASDVDYIIDALRDVNSAPDTQVTVKLKEAGVSTDFIAENQ